MGSLTLSPIFETAISLLVVWFLLSLVVSGVIETIASLLKFRGKYLWTSLELLFRRATGADATAGPQALRKLTAEPALSNVVIADNAGGAAPGTVLAHTVPVADNPPAGPEDNAMQIFTKVIALMPGVPTDAEALKKIKRVNPSMLVDSILAVQKTNPAEFGETAIGKALVPFAGGDLDTMRASVERWVDDAMYRMSAAYRGNMRRIGAIVAVLVVLPLGVDTVWSTQHFYASSTARSAAIAVAGTATNTGSAYADCLTNAVPVDTTSTSTPAPAADAETTPDGDAGADANAATPKECANDAVDDLDRLAVQRYQLTPGRWISRPDGLDGWAIMIVGLLLSAGAASMGAPFWFDVLKRAMGIRQRNQPAAGSS